MYMENNLFFCEFCNYSTKRNYNLKRHHNAVHNRNSPKIKNEENHMQIEENDMQKEENDMQKEEKDMQIEENHIHIEENLKQSFYCSKCAKQYKTKKYLINHEEKCNGLHILTCPKCMKTFSTHGNKSAHMKKNNCKARSIIHAVNPDVKHSLYINGNNNNNNTTTTTTIINNYGSERTDYITFDDMMRILLHSGNNIIPKYIEFKHFNKNFPENHNIKYERNNGCLIRKDGEWKLTNIDYLSNNLIDKNSSEILKYYNNQKKDIETKIKNIELIDFINKRFNYLDLSFNKDIYNSIKFEIKNIIKTTMVI